MIVVTKHINGITVKGHAGYEEAGKDIVCAAISTLTETLIESLTQLSLTDIKAVTADGEASVRYKSELTDTAELLISSFFIGCEGVAGTYPDNYWSLRRLYRSQPECLLLKSG